MGRGPIRRNIESVRLAVQFAPVVGAQQAGGCVVMTEHCGNRFIQAATSARRWTSSDAQTEL
jgi:hypothetical protein